MLDLFQMPLCLKEWHLIIGEGPVQNASTRKEAKNLKKSQNQKIPKKPTTNNQPNKKIDSNNKLQHFQLPESITVNRYMLVKTNSYVFFSSRMTLCRVY